MLIGAGGVGGHAAAGCGAGHVRAHITRHARARAAVHPPPAPATAQNPGQQIGAPGGGLGAEVTGRITQQDVAFIEVKRCSQKLNMRHLRQVQMYAVNEGVEWMILTNGQVWQVYHMTGGLPVVIDLALEVDLLGEAGLAAKTDALFYLSKDAFKRRLIDDLWKARAATSAKSLAQVVLSDLVIDAIRKEVRRQTNHNAEPKDLVRILRAEVLRSEALS
ncbi:hypothetical protein AB0M44_05975 [Streptosporangium subroseum]|uniref:hypothetical protein n=1 Tax=Streptosporangium subroseum TaxID=106412 RepID=UPI0034201F95